MELQYDKFPNERYLKINEKRLKQEFLDSIIYELTDGFSNDYANHVYDDILDELIEPPLSTPSEETLRKASKYYYCTDKSVNPRNLDFDHAASLYASNKNWFKNQDMLKNLNDDFYYSFMDTDMWDFQAESDIFSEMSNYVTHLEYTNYMSEVYFSIKTDFFFDYSNLYFNGKDTNLSNIFNDALDSLVHFDNYKKKFKVHAGWIKNNKYNSLKNDQSKEIYFNINSFRDSGIYIPDELTIRMASFWHNSQVSDCDTPLSVAATIEGWDFNYQENKDKFIDRYPGDIEILI